MPRGGNHSTAHSQLVTDCITYVSYRGAWVLKVWGNPFMRAGVPDILVCLRGRFVAIEVKTGKAELGVKQQDERDKLLAAGALYILARSLGDLEEALLTAGLVDAPALTRQRV